MSTETTTAACVREKETPAPSRRGRWLKWLNPKILFGLLVAFALGLVVHASKGAPYIASIQKEVLVDGVDLDRTLVIAEREMQKTGFASVLTIWGIRDQIFTDAQAETVSSLYFRHIETMQDYFRLWHLTWAISNIYRNGDATVRTALELAYQDATKRAKAAGGFADAHVNGPIVMGDIHLPARLFVRAHVVAPGAAGFLQSIEDYKP